MKRQQNGSAHIIVILLLVVVIIGALGYVFYTNFITKQSKSSASTSSQTKQPITSAEQLIAKVKSSIKTPIAPTKVSSDGSSASMIDPSYTAYSVVAMQPTGYEFEVRPTKSYGFTSASNDKAAIAADTKAVTQLILDNDVASENIYPADTLNSISSSQEFHNTHMNCTVTATDFHHSLGGHQLSVACADLSSYADKAKTLKPFYDVYIAKNPIDTSTTRLTLFVNSFSDSKTAGYKLADLEISTTYNGGGGSGFAAEFYQTPDGAWHHFGNAQSGFQCSDFKTLDEKKAFLGQSCYDSSSSSTVSL